MIQLKEREKKFIIIGVIIIAISLAYAYAFYPMYTKIINLRQHYTETQDTVKDLDQKKLVVKQLEQKVNQDMMKLKTVEKNLPTGKNIHKLVVDLESIIDKNRLRQHVFAPQDLEDRENYYILPINIRVSGEFNNIIGFLRDWENHERLVNIAEGRMYLDKDNNIVGEFVANIYILKSEEGL